MWRTILASSILAIGTNLTSAIADTHYVSHDGSNTYPYTSWATATDSILEAIRAAEEWDTVLLAAGEYTADSLPLKKGLAFIGAGRDSTRIIHNGNFPYCIILVDSCLVEGIHLQGQTDTVFHNITFHLEYAVIAGTDQSAIIHRNRFTDFKYGIWLWRTDWYNPTKRVSVEDNEFSNFSLAVDASFASTQILGNSFLVNYNDIGGPIKQLQRRAEIRSNYFYRTVRFSNPLIDIEECDSIWIQNNVCIATSGNDGYAINCNFQSGYPAVGVIENNLCMGASTGIWSGGGNVRIRNNTVIGTELGALFYDTMSTAPGYVGFNLYWNNEHTWGLPRDMSLRPDPGNLFADPMFVDSLNFHLQAFSPAIDAGDSLLLDLNGSRSDIGPYGGLLGETYAYLDLPPAIPRGFAGTPSAAKIDLIWRRNSEADFDHYELYRDTIDILAPDLDLLLISLSSDTVFADSMILPGDAYFYRLRAVDAQVNASDLTDELQFVAAGVDGDELPLPGAFVLYPGYPNPFNASTRITIDVPTPGRLDVNVYDVLGRKVGALQSGAVSVGRHVFDWQPTDAGSGMYFIVAKLNNTTRVQKALLLK